MSLYRFLRASALTTLVVKYKGKLYRIALAAAFALVTAYAYGDIAAFLQANYPQLAGAALAVKTAVIYCALFYAFWQFRPLVSEADETPAKGTTPSPAETDAGDDFSRLDALGDIGNKPSLRQRKAAILEGKGPEGQA